MNGRYHKHELFQGLGLKGQEALRRSGILVAGVGATGGTQAALMARAGIGLLRLVDKDTPDLGNLHRQLLYDENGVREGKFKADLAADYLRRCNSDVKVEGIVANVTTENVLDLMSDVDLVLDGTDNQATRYLLNDAAVYQSIPWVYVGAVGSAANVMPIIPGQTPCFRCIFPEPAPENMLPTCDTIGIIGPVPALAASMAAAQAIKLLADPGTRYYPRLFTFDLWSGFFRAVELPPEPMKDCPCCGKKQFEFLGK